MAPASCARPATFAPVWWSPTALPVTGLLDVGRYPSGVDATVVSLADAIDATSFLSLARPDIMRWKYRKLVMNLANAAEALGGPAARTSPVVKEAQREGTEALVAAGIAVASVEEDRARRSDHLSMGTAERAKWRGGSSWQSLERRTGAIEADFLNGEIVLLGALFGVATPVNALSTRLAQRVARQGQAPAKMDLGTLSALAGVPVEL